MSKKVILYIAASLDGYIARKNDDISWLDAYQGTGEDYGFSDFRKKIGTAMIGARTYEQSLKFPKRLLKDIKTYVLSDNPLPVPNGIDVEFYNGDLTTLISKIKKEINKDIWLVGGGRVVSSFLSAGLVDDILHFVVPVLLKEGIPLYPSLSKEINFTLVEAVSYKTGIVKLHYVPKGMKSKPRD